MSRTPRITGPDLIAILGKLGFYVLRIKGTTTSFAMMMAGAQWCPRTQARQSAPDCCTRFSAIVN
jgi:hypothetical protein